MSSSSLFVLPRRESYSNLHAYHQWLSCVCSHCVSCRHIDFIRLRPIIATPTSCSHHGQPTISLWTIPCPVKPIHPIGLRWPPYLRRLENMFTGLAITDSTQKKSLLLYYSGVEVSDIFDTLTVASGEGVDVYKAATDALTAHFARVKTQNMNDSCFVTLSRILVRLWMHLTRDYKEWRNRAVFMIRTQKSNHKS